jgi:hypothetical protein
MHEGIPTPPGIFSTSLDLLMDLGSMSHLILVHVYNELLLLLEPFFKLK